MHPSLSGRRAGSASRIRSVAAAALATGLVLLSPTVAQETDPGTTRTAPVVVDGDRLFDLRGASAFPAAERARQVRERIIDAAADESIPADSLRVEHLPDRSNLIAGDLVLFGVFEEDGEVEGIDRRLLSQVYLERIRQTINDYRRDRSTPVLLRNTAFALGSTVVMIFLGWVLVRLFRWLDDWSERHVQRRVEKLATKTHQIFHAGQVWSVIAGLLRAARLLAFLLLIYFFLNTVLGLYPWTRPVAFALFGLVINPLQSLWSGFVASLPGLMFLIILFFVTRYLLRIIRAFFSGIENGRIRLSGFDPEWAQPTYKILRILIIAFAVVVAYPYIPGSDSMAFKGVSLFLGVILSLGSSSFIANMLAGLAMTYRGAFKEGDRVRIGDVAGKVDEIKMMVTRIRTPKNEIVILPNSNILNTNVVNYSALAREQGLVLHTTVGIGYDTPWRQVEALLLRAAERTPGLMREPGPFVLQTGLGDFAVNYQLNVYCDDPAKMLALYSALHANIQDAFNEHGVQIMSPAYEADPATPKIVPPERWYEAPATRAPENLHTPTAGSSE